MMTALGSRQIHRTRAMPWFKGIVLLSIVLLQAGWTANAHHLHACPHHGLPESAEHEAPPTPGHHAQHEHAGHAEAANAGAPPAQFTAASHASDSGHPAGEGHGPCTCIGDCSGATALTLSLRAAEVDRAAQVIVRAFRAADTTLDVVALQPYLLPFSLAPPFPSV